MDFINTVFGRMVLFLLIVLVPGCAALDPKGVADNVSFRLVGGYGGQTEQARIRVIVYSGKPKEGNIKQYAEKMGCGMIFAYFYPDSTDMNDIPVVELADARNFIEARDVLFKGEGFGKWSYATKCMGIITTLTDCVEHPISTNCR